MAPLTRAPHSSKPSTILQHLTHPDHPLHLLYIPTEFLCNGCDALGYGARYRCEICDFDLHDICATSPTSTTSALHPEHPLTLVNQPANYRCCNLCGDVVHGLFYRCRACDFDVHPLCTQLPLHVQLPLHPHHLLKLHPAGPAACALCFKACTSWRYRCDICILDIHLECVLNAGPQTTAKIPTQVVAPLPPLQEGCFGGCAVGVPVGCGGGYRACGLPSPVMMTMGQPCTAEGQTRSGKTRRKIYSILGRLAVAAVVIAIL